jgi:uncharacterized protein involved in oxidation of intracellular sulfur
VFLIGGAVAAAHNGQKVPSGYYDVPTMLGAVTKRNAAVGVCGSSMDARGIAEADLAEGTPRSSMEELTGRTPEADKVITF